MHPLFRSYKKMIPPPIFSIVMAVIFILIGSRTITRGWFNTGRGSYERIITFSSNPAEFAFWVLVPFLFCIASTVLAYQAYTKNCGENTKNYTYRPEKSCESNTLAGTIGKIFNYAALSLVIASLILRILAAMNVVKPMSGDDVKLFLFFVLLSILVSVLASGEVGGHVPVRRKDHPSRYWFLVLLISIFFVTVAKDIIKLTFK